MWWHIPMWLALQEATFSSIMFYCRIFCSCYFGVLQILVTLSRCIEKTRRRKGICSYHLLAPFSWCCFSRINLGVVSLGSFCIVRCSSCENGWSLLYHQRKPVCFHCCLCFTRGDKLVMISAWLAYLGPVFYLLK